VLRGKIYETLTNRGLVKIIKKRWQDIYCFEAFELCAQHQTLSRNKDVYLLLSLLCFPELRAYQVINFRTLKKYPSKGDKVTKVTKSIRPILFTIAKKPVQELVIGNFILFCLFPQTKGF